MVSVMFEWPNFKSVDMSSYDRKDLYEHFLTFEIPVATRTIQLDVTHLMSFIKQHNYKFSLFIGFILTRAANLVPEFRLRIHGDNELVAYEKIIPSFTILSDDKRLFFSKGVFTNGFQSDYYENLEINQRAANGLEPNLGNQNAGQMFISVNPWNQFTGLQFPYSKKHSSMPTISIGKLYEERGRSFVPFAIQTHHGLIDGYHMGQFVKIIEHHLQKPDLVMTDYKPTQ